MDTQPSMASSPLISIKIGLAAQSQSESYTATCLTITSTSSSPIVPPHPNLGTGTTTRQYFSLPPRKLLTRKPTTASPSNLTSSETPSSGFSQNQIDNWPSTDPLKDSRAGTTTEASRTTHQTAWTVLNTHMTRGLLSQMTSTRATGRILNILRRHQSFLQKVPPGTTHITTLLASSTLIHGRTTQYTQSLHPCKECALGSRTILSPTPTSQNHVGALQRR